MSSRGAVLRMYHVDLQERTCSAPRGAGPDLIVYLAENEDLIREHARISGFPANKITEIVTVIDPSTANAPAAVR